MTCSSNSTQRLSHGVSVIECAKAAGESSCVRAFQYSDHLSLWIRGSTTRRKSCSAPVGVSIRRGNGRAAGPVSLGGSDTVVRPQLRSQLTEGCCNDAARPAMIRGRQRYFPDPGQLSSAVLVLQAVSRLVGGKECNRVEGYNYLRFCSSFGSEGRQMCMADMSASISAFRTKHQQRALVSLVRSANQVLQRQASRASSRQPGAQPSS